MTWRRAVAAAVIVRGMLIAAAASLRGSGAFAVPDSETYLRLANVLASRFAFLDAFGGPETFRTPGYPVLLLPGAAIGHAFEFAIALNVALSAAIVVVTYAIARRLFASERVAVICALVVALEPTLLIWSIKVMPEAALTLALLLFTYAVLRERFVLAAIALSIAAYVKPVAWPLVLVMMVVAFVAIPWRRATAFALVCVALLAPWHIRNAMQSGYAGFSSVVERMVYLSAAGSIAAERAHVSHAEMRRRMIERDDLRGAGVDGTKLARIRREGLAIVATDPFGYAKVHVKGMMRTLFDPGAVEYLRVLGLYGEGGRAVAESGGFVAAARAYPLPVAASIVMAIALLPLVLLPVAGAFRVPPELRRAFVLCALIAAYLIFAGGGVHGSNRFRVPAVPFLIVMAVIAFRPSARYTPAQ